MFFCEKCHYLFNITKDVESKQIGGKINSALTNLFEKYNAGEPATRRDLKGLTAKDLLEDDRFESIKRKTDKTKMMSWVKAADKSFFAKQSGAAETNIASNQAFFICKFCKFSKPIEPGTLLYSKDYGAISADNEDYTYAIYDQTLARTRDYICKNPDCASHTDDSVKEAILTKNSNYQAVYVCCACTVHWTAGVN